jgi:hypothetical protein
MELDLVKVGLLLVSIIAPFLYILVIGLPLLAFLELLMWVAELRWL